MPLPGGIQMSHQHPFRSALGLPPEQVDEHRQHDADDHHRGNREEKLPTFRLDVDVTRQLAEPVQQARGVVKDETYHHQHPACED